MGSSTREANGSISTKDLRAEVLEFLDGLLDIVHGRMLTIAGLDVLLLVPPET